MAKKKAYKPGPHTKHNESTKTTVTLPRAIKEGGILYAQHHGYSSFSTLISVLLFDKIKDTISVPIEFTPDALEKFREEARKNKQSAQVFAKELLALGLKAHRDQQAAKAEILGKQQNV